MLNIFIDAVIFFLVIYALFNISLKLFELSKCSTYPKNFHAAITPEDDDSLEYTVRCTALKCEKTGLELIVLDDNLSQTGKFIITSLTHEFSGLSLLSKEEYIEKFL